MRPFPKKLGIVLFNLGGPETIADVKPFLLNLFNDPDIITIPIAFVRSLVARIIVAARLKHVIEHYEEIGGGSPLRRLTEEQAHALEAALREQTGADITVRVGMRYWKPFTNEVVKEFRAKGIDDVFLLPLYPQYSCTTSGSSFKEWKLLHNALGGKVFRVTSIRDFYRDEAYLRSLNAAINDGVAKFSAEERKSLHLLFSAHGLPQAVVEAGDPYPQHIKETVASIMTMRGNDLPHHLSYQSKVGPTKWLKPYTVDRLAELGKEGVKNLLVIPVAFVGDHIETLHELDIELREIAEKAGVTHYVVTEGLNSRPEFISALAGLVRRRYS